MIGAGYWAASFYFLWRDDEIGVPAVYDALSATRHEGAFCVEHRPRGKWRCNELHALSESGETHRWPNEAGVL